MYERMLDKSLSPSFEDLLAYSGESRPLWLELDAYLKALHAQQTIRFPYGNKYGWSSKYSIKSKHVCDAFAENGAFSLHFRLSKSCIDLAYSELSDYAKAVCDEMYPCSEGGWLTYRVLTEEQLEDAKKLLALKIEAK